MPPRRGARRRGGGPQRTRSQQTKNDSMEQDSMNESLEESQLDESQSDAMEEAQNGTADGKMDKMDSQEENTLENEEKGLKIKKEPTNGDIPNSSIKTEVNADKTTEIKTETATSDMSFKVKVSHLPANYNLTEFSSYLKYTFQLNVPKLISPCENSPWILIPAESKEEQENLIKLLHNHVWKKKALRAIVYYSPQKRTLEDGDGPDSKRLKEDEVMVLTLEEEILSESLPLYDVPYEEQNRLTILDVQLLSNKLHAFMCFRNPALAGWAEAMTEQNDGSLFKIEPLKPSPLLEGYRNKCKFRIGKNTDGETTVGFCLNDNENKILGVQPGDKLIHLPDSMKFAAKKFEEFIRTCGREPYDKKQKKGFWDHIIIRVAPEGKLMLVIVMYHNQLTDEGISEVKEQIKDFFVNGNGKECNLYSLYLQIMVDKAPILPSEKLELLHGESHFLENICGMKFYVGPFSILNVNSSSTENIYRSIAELAEPTPDTVVLDLCSGTGGIAFTISNKCKKVIAIESQEDHIRDGLKTKEINNIENVDFIKGKVEDVLGEVFEKVGDAPVIPIIDPPRQGLVQKAISQLRARESIKKMVYVCSNSKMGAKNFLDLCASADKKEGTFGNPLNVVFSGLPFLPVRAIPVDVAPFTVNNTIIILFERIDPSTFPPAKKPPPAPMKKPQVRTDERKKKRNPSRRFRGRDRPGGGGSGGGGGGNAPGSGRLGRKFRPSGPSSRGNRSGQFFRRSGHQGNYNQPRFPPPLLRPMEPALSLVAKYERRIAELEQQDRAFKAGLTMGLQALNTRGGPGPVGGGGGANFDNFGSNFNGGNMGSNFGNFRGQFSRERKGGWQRNNSGGGIGGGGGGGNIGGGGGRNFGFGGGNNYGGGFGSSGGGGGGGNSGGGFNNFSSGGGFNNFGGGPGNYNSNFGGGGGGSGNFSSNFGGGGGGGSGFRNYQGNLFSRR